MTVYLMFLQSLEQIQISNQPISLSHHKYNRPANTNTGANHPSISENMESPDEFALNLDPSILDC